YADGVLAQTGRRTTALGMAPFTVDSETGRLEWRGLLLAIEQRPVLARQQPGGFGGDLSDYLFPPRTRHHGSPLTLINPGQPGDRHAGRTILLRPAEITAISAATGIAPDIVRAMTLARYDQRAVVIDLATRRVNIRTMWGRGAGSRYCPDCLADTSGRWQIAWRLSWSFACLTHR